MGALALCDSGVLRSAQVEWKISASREIRCTKAYQTQFQRPHAPRPKFDNARCLTSLGNVNVEAIPPAFTLQGISSSVLRAAIGRCDIYRRFSPEQQKLLSCAHLVVIDGNTSSGGVRWIGMGNTCLEQDQGN